MVRSRLVRSVVVLAALVAGTAGIEVAARAAAAVSCPTVTSGTGVVTPAPSAGVDWSGCDLAGADLHSTVLYQATLTGANLKGADLAGANMFQAGLSGADLTGANMANAILASATMVNAAISGTDFSGADLTGATAVGTPITHANFTNATLISFTADSISDSDLTGADISLATLGATTFTGIRSARTGTTKGNPTLPAGWILEQYGYLIGPGADLSDMSFTAIEQANLIPPVLEQVNAADINFNGTDFRTLNGTPQTGWLMDHSNLARSSFVNANLTYVDLDNSSLTGADLQGADLTGAILTGVVSGQITGAPKVLPANWELIHGYLVGAGAGLDRAQLAGANLSGFNLRNAYLAEANLRNVNFTNADLTGAEIADADVNGAIWANTTCPNGVNSDANNHTCAVSTNIKPPAAQPVVTGTSVNGWYRKATVTWNWSSNIVLLDPSTATDCPATTTTSAQGNPVSITASCGNLYGDVGRAVVRVKIENKGPAVTVTGVAAGRVYAAGHVPAAGCRTTDTLSGVATAAKVAVATTGSHGVGSFTVTCAGGYNRAGIGQAGPVRTKYVVAYGVSGVLSPAGKSAVPRSAHVVAVSFRLSGLSAAVAARFASAGDVRVTLTGPGISPVTVAAAWRSKSGTFTARLPIPAAVKTGQNYLITIRENVGTGLISAPPTGAGVNPEIIRFS
jgi:uncharacterized protein YjbI with pentapeptide repeats